MVACALYQRGQPLIAAGLGSHRDQLGQAESRARTRPDVQVELEGGGLVVRGESRQERQVRDEDYYRTERGFGSFYRRLPLPFDVDPNQIQASMANGVLEVRIPKPAETRTEARRIQVK
jgi:HSP20 family protein